MSKKPKKDTRFKPGKSGNPKGRPKRAKNRATLLEEVVNVRIQVSENGQRKNVTKFEAGYIQLANKAASGDLQAIKILNDMYDRHVRNRPSEAASPVAAPPSAAPPQTEEEAAQRYLEAIKKATPRE